jgi:hypothetical protein
MRREIHSRIFRSFEAEQQADRMYWLSLSPAERLAMMWQLTKDAWAFTGERVAESRLSRHIVRIHRTKS